MYAFVWKSSEVRAYAFGSIWNDGTILCFTPTEAAAIDHPHISSTQSWMILAGSGLPRSV